MKNVLLAFLLFISLTGCFSKKHFVKIPVKEPFDVIIVPGYPHYKEKWEDVMKIRVYWSKYLFEKGYTKNIIYSGSAVYSKYIEAQTMLIYAQKLGVDTAHIFLENKAEHSTENLYYSYQIAKKMGFSKIALASDPFQTKNLKPFIKRYKLPVEMLPINFDTMVVVEKIDPVVDLSSAIKKDYIPLKEREGFFKRLGGTFGRHIIWQEEDLIKKRHRKRMKRKGRCL